MFNMPKYNLGFFPTPLHELKNFSAGYSGYRVFIKRDDHTGLATGGNKTRKLEFLIGDALAQGADTVITAGAQQSNHCRQTAAACATASLKCHLLLGGNPPDQDTGNLLLSKLLGATIHFTGKQRKGEDLETLSDKLKEKGAKPCIIPYGGSNIVGAMGYVEATGELKQQLENEGLKIDYIFFASSSGGMQAGLTLGMALYDLQTTLMPVRIDKQETAGLSLKDIIRDLIKQGIQVFDLNKFIDLKNIPLIKGFEEAGYAVVTHQEKKAIQTLARTEGVLLDPVYTGRAFYGMMHFLEQGLLKPKSNVLFWHTGGVPANFHYAKYLID